MTKPGWDSIGTASCYKGGAYLFERVLTLNALMGAEHRVEELTSLGTGFVGRHLHNPQLLKHPLNFRVQIPRDP